jgi:uncharacterized OB-fold protein
VRGRRGCPRCPTQYLHAVRVRPDGQVTFRKLGTSRNRHVVATWCERCGAVDVDGRIFQPRARVAEDAR